MKKIFSILVVFALSVSLASCNATETSFDLETETEIIVGLEAAYAPFNWSTPTENEFTVEIEGQTGMFADGFDIVMARAIASDLGLELVIKAIEWDGLIPALLSGEIDMIIAGMSPTSERAQTIAFSEAYYQSEQVMVVRLDGDYSNATAISDFANARVVAQIGTLQDDLIDQISQVNHLSPLDDYATLTTSLLNNASDAFVAELPVAQGIVAANPDELTFIQFGEGLGFNVSIEDVTVSVGLRQEDTSLLGAVNEALSRISTTLRNDYMEAALNRQPA